MAESQEWAFPAELQPSPDEVGFDLRGALDAVVALRSEVPEDAFTASSAPRKSKPTSSGDGWSSAGNAHSCDSAIVAMKRRQRNPSYRVLRCAIFIRGLLHHAYASPTDESETHR